RSLQPVHLILLHREPGVEALLLHLVDLPLHGCHPAAILIADMHEDAHRLEDGHFADIRTVQQPRIACQRADVLRIPRGDMKRADAAVRVTGYAKFFALHLVVSQKLLQEFREDAVGTFEEEASVRRPGADQYVAAALALLAP